jgi:hypothetical protein
VPQAGAVEHDQGPGGRGQLYLDDSVAISEAVYDRIVLRHYAFAGHWFKINITTDLSGRLTETGDGTRRFAVNCDIATPMEREGDSTFGVDLFTDVLVRQPPGRAGLGAPPPRGHRSAPHPGRRSRHRHRRVRQPAAGRAITRRP